MTIQDDRNVYVVQSSADANRSSSDRSHATDWRERGFDLQEFLRIFWRRKTTVVGTIVVVVALTLVVLSQITPRFLATALVEINARQSRIVDFEAVLSGLPADTQTMETEIEIIESANLANRTIERLDLRRVSEFNAALRQPGGVAALLKTPGLTDLLASAKALGIPLAAGDQEKQPLSLEESVKLEKQATLEKFLERLQVGPRGRSRVVEISFESESPATAAAAVNTLADFYIVSQLEAKFEATKRANNWLSARISELREEVLSAEKAVETFRAKTGLLRGEGDTTLTSQQVSELSTQLIVERTKLAEATARLRQVERLLNSPGEVETATEVLNSELIRALRAQEAELERRLAELSMEYGERHPRMINTRAELADLRSKIGLEVKKIVEGLRNEVAVAQARVSAIRSSLKELEGEVGRNNASEVQLRALEREAAASRSLLEMLLGRSKETISQASFQEADATVLSYAGAPQAPSYPKRPVILGLSVVGGSFLGLLLALAREKLDRGFRSAEQIERSLGIAPLGLTPILKGKVGRHKAPDMYVLEKPSSAFGESIRSLHTNLLLTGSKRRPKVILISSTLPNEGKSTIVMSLARTLASTGQKIIVLDCDLRKPSIHSKCELTREPGLTEYVSGTASLPEVVRKDEHSPAHVLSAGALVPHPPNILASKSMEKLINSLAERYDMVIIDSPPVMAVSDALILGRFVDKAVFVVRYSETPREAVAIGLKRLIDVGVDVAGVLLSMVKVKEHATYGFGDSGAYSGDIQKYYSG